MILCSDSEVLSVCIFVFVLVCLCLCLCMSMTDCMYDFLNVDNQNYAKAGFIIL